jgi:hypothetical protein
MKGLATNVAVDQGEGVQETVKPKSPMVRPKSKKSKKKVRLEQAESSKMDTVRPFVARNRGKTLLARVSSTPKVAEEELDVDMPRQSSANRPSTAKPKNQTLNPKIESILRLKTPVLLEAYRLFQSLEETGETNHQVLISN